MITRPAVHGPASTVGELRAFFRDDHVHMALLVEAGTLLGVVERSDLRRARDDDAPASTVAQLDGRTIRPDAPLRDAFVALRHAGRRRLAVTTDGSVLVGLLCLKASGLGFCSADDVRSRRSSAPRPVQPSPQRTGLPPVTGYAPPDM